ncbi:hypothetical protein ASF22_17610 [Methylobacterium sp. Leaf87]|nr:hypothetical protein ASF22_17610 [Methylobacterium sp. Leaf87]KQP67305.1 hypothetical protein ASF52_19685 [Methylobacterium sp. Leaf112]
MRCVETLDGPVVAVMRFAEVFACANVVWILENCWLRKLTARAGVSLQKRSQTACVSSFRRASFAGPTRCPPSGEGAGQSGMVGLKLLS